MTAISSRPPQLPLHLPGFPMSIAVKEYKHVYAESMPLITLVRQGHGATGFSGLIQVEELMDDELKTGIR